MATIKSHNKAKPAKDLDAAKAMDWRPLVGLDLAISELNAMMASGRMHPVVLLEGREGLGKRHLAYWFAAKQLCSGSTSEHQTPCGLCADCQEVMAGSHNDLMVIDAEDESIKTSDIEMFQQHLEILSTTGKRVGLILNAEKMTREAANRALKTLEEPTEQARVVLTSSRPLMLPKTVLGRCLRWKIKPLVKSEVLQWFQAKKESIKGTRENIATLDVVAKRWGYSPGQIFRNELKQESSVSQAIDAEIRKLLQAQAPIEVLQSASDLTKTHKVKLPEMLRAVEWNLSDSLRKQLLETGHVESNLVSDLQNVRRTRRRALLRDVRAKAVFGKIALNTQLVAESIGLCNWDEGES